VVDCGGGSTGEMLWAQEQDYCAEFINYVIGIIKVEYLTVQ